jgi:phage protein D
LITSGFRPDINGEWKISSVTHTMDNSGYKFSLKAEQELE